MCRLQPPGYPKRDKLEPLPYWDVQADLSLWWLHSYNCRFCRALAIIQNIQVSQLDSLLHGLDLGGSFVAVLHRLYVGYCNFVVVSCHSSFLIFLAASEQLCFVFVAFPSNFFYTVNPSYNDSICSQRRCHLNKFAVAQNTY